MKKFGFGKKKDDSSRTSNSSSSSSSNPYAQPPSQNPYAQANIAADPYAQDVQKHAGTPVTPYQQAKASYGGLPSGPRNGSHGAPGPLAGAAVASRSDYGSQPAVDRYGTSTQGGYGSERFGNGGGYGTNRHEGSSGDYAQPVASRGPSGYGGLGRTNSYDTTTTEDNRDALFGDAKSRFQQKQQQQQQMPPEYDQALGGADVSSNGGESGGYGTYGEDRQLTAEEEEEEDILATKQQIKFMKQEDVSSTRNALRIAAQAEETGRATLARLGAQGERIHNTEKNLDLAANHNRIAEERAKELKQLNKSMFAVHVSNPFTKSQRRAARDEDIMSKHRNEREQRDATRHAAFGTQQRMEGAFRQLQPGDEGYRPKAATKASLAERSKYQFEADSEDDEMENEIDHNLDALSGAASRLNALARATGEEVDVQNKHIDRIIQKSDKVDDQIAMNRARLDRIR